MKHPPLPHLLTFAGAIPFVCGALLLGFDVKTLSALESNISVGTILTSYALAIVSFMAGCQWGVHLSREDRWVKVLPIASNAITLVAWFAYLLASVRISLIVMACCFLALLVIDGKLKAENILTTDYYRVRCWVSKIVILSLCIASVLVA